MFETKFGPFDGNSWEALIQQVLKDKHGCEGYQEMPASPGDFGLEGFTLKTGLGFQCYCPDEHYDNDTLFEKQKEKIERDIGKLQKYQVDIGKRIQAPLVDWHFICPKIHRHKLLIVARAEEARARSWGLSILSPDFTIILEDCDFYQQEISNALAVNGVPFSVPAMATPIPELGAGPVDEYESNLLRKTTTRLIERQPDASKLAVDIQRLYGKTHKDFLAHDEYFKEINRTAPGIYFRISRILAQVQSEIEQDSLTWSGKPEQLVVATKTLLQTRLKEDLANSVDGSTIAKVVQITIARWLAVCEIDFQE